MYYESSLLSEGGLEVVATLRAFSVALALLICGAMNLGAGAVAAERLALVIGNGAYGSLGRLANPVSDARLIADALESAGFAVTLLTEADQRAMKRAIIDFGRQLRAAPRDAVGAFYFAGHGVQANGRNFLLPVNVDVRDEADLHIEAVQADWVLRQMESAGNAINIIVLDACRNNPFARSFRSAERGLARMSAPTGSFVAYATAPGDVALDGDGRNSPYSAALAKAILTPGLPIEHAFKKVRVDVLERTGGRQTPWESSSLTGDFYFKPGQAETASVPEARQEVTTPPTSESSRFATIPDEPTTSSAVRSIRLRIAMNYRQNSWSSCDGTDLGTVRVKVDNTPTQVGVGSTGTKSLNYIVSAHQDGAGAQVKLEPIADGDHLGPIEVRLDSLSPGTQSVTYSNVRHPSIPACGGLVAYVEVVE